MRSDGAVAGGDGNPRTPEELRLAARDLASRLDWPPASHGNKFVRWLGVIFRDERQYQGGAYPPEGLWEWRHRDFVLTPDGVALLVGEGVGRVRDVGKIPASVVAPATDEDLSNAGGSLHVNDYVWEDGAQKVQSRRAQEGEIAVRKTWLLLLTAAKVAATGPYETRY